MNNKRKIIVLSFVLIILFGVLFAFFYFQQSKKVVLESKPRVDLKTIPETKITPSPLVTTSPAQVSQKEQNQVLIQAYLQSIARSFVERYGSFSNQGNFENLTDLYPLMTKKFQEKTKAFIEERLANRKPNQEYYGITTVVLNVETLESAPDRVVFLIKTQRQESTAQTLNAKIYYQDVKLILVSENNFWKVDSLEWL